MSADVAVAKQKPCYFLVSVSTRENLELCIRHALAGFPSGASGAWTFCEIKEGDFVSFLYGAKAYNLYRVTRKEAISAAEILPPWKPLFFEESGRTYSFPFRLHLQPIRVFVESLVRTEFSYVAENLLLRGGYRKTHFQADQTTLQSVSEMGTRTYDSAAALALPEYSTFTPRFTRSPNLVNAPGICRFNETILQSAIRRYLMFEDNLQMFLTRLNLAGMQAGELEILGEKALPQGHIDLLLKQRAPLGTAPKIPIEVKTNRGNEEDLSQLGGYMDELRGECPIGVLVAAEFSKDAVSKAVDARITLVRYALNVDLKKTPTFEQICQGVTLEPLGK